MDNAQKAIMIGVGLFITIIIISAVLLITNLGTNLINNARGELGSMSTALQGQILSAYDAQKLSGSEVLSAVQQYENSNSLCVVITNGTNTFKTGALALDITGVQATDLSRSGGVEVDITGTTSKFGTGNDETKKSTMAEITDTTKGINTASTYQSTIVKDTNSKKVIGLIFTRI